MTLHLESAARSFRFGGFASNLSPAARCERQMGLSISPDNYGAPSQHQTLIGCLAQQLGCALRTNARGSVRALFSVIFELSAYLPYLAAVLESAVRNLEVGKPPIRIGGLGSTFNVHLAVVIP